MTIGIRGRKKRRQLDQIMNRNTRITPHSFPSEILDQFILNLFWRNVMFVPDRTYVWLMNTIDEYNLNVCGFPRTISNITKLLQIYHDLKSGA